MDKTNGLNFKRYTLIVNPCVTFKESDKAFVDSDIYIEVIEKGAINESNN
jgi:hypothetical protein